MLRRYFSSRNKNTKLGIVDFYSKVESLFLLFQKQDYFKEKLGITENDIPESAILKAKIVINFSPYPFKHWTIIKRQESEIFDTIEFLHDCISKPQEWVSMTTETGYNSYDYESYDSEIGQQEFREYVNPFLIQYGDGFEITDRGEILAIAEDELQSIVIAEGSVSQFMIVVMNI